MDKQKIELKKVAENQEDAPVKDVALPVKKIKNTRKIKPWILLVVIDFLMLLMSGFIILELPKKAEELNKVRSEEQKIKESKNIDVNGLEYPPTKEKVNELNGYFPEEAGVIAFIESIEALREKGIARNFSLVAQDAVKDKTGSFGIPFIVYFEGSWENIDKSLQEFQDLPYLIRAVNVETEMIDNEIVILRYGGFLYVSEKLAKVR